MKIVFMGTPDYAVHTLEALLAAGHEVAAVFVQPDKPVGRKHILTPPPVKVCALSHGLPVYQPQTLRSGEAEQTLREIAPDVICVVAYGKILPESILKIPRYGCVNGHASLLPKYRGASPIQWSIVCGETVTGITTMFMDKGMDTGDILEQQEVAILPEETAEELFDRLAPVSARLMVSTLRLLEEGKITPKKQDESLATYAPIIKKEMALVDFSKTAREVHNAVRGYYSWPCAYFYLKGKRTKAISCHIGGKTGMDAGTVVSADNCLEVACGDGMTVCFDTLQPEGSKIMSATGMLCGNPVEKGTKIGEMND